MMSEISMGDYEAFLKGEFVKRREEIDDVVKGTNVFDEGFLTWKRRTIDILLKAYGQDSPLYLDYKQLQFNEPRIRQDEGEWSANDKYIFQQDVNRAKDILDDALNQWDFREHKTKGEIGEAVHSKTLIINNILMQIDNINIAEIKASIGSIGLSAEAEKKSRALIDEFEKEARGGRDWKKMGEIIEKLKRISRLVYREIVVPLIIDYIKKEMKKEG